MNISKNFGRSYFLFFVVIALMPINANSGSGDGYFDAPSGNLGTSMISVVKGEGGSLFSSLFSVAFRY
jgi:hypothetical protein